MSAVQNIDEWIYIYRCLFTCVELPRANICSFRALSRQYWIPRDVVTFMNSPPKCSVPGERSYPTLKFLSLPFSSRLTLCEDWVSSLKLSIETVRPVALGPCLGIPSFMCKTATPAETQVPHALYSRTRKPHVLYTGTSPAPLLQAPFLQCSTHKELQLWIGRTSKFHVTADRLQTL